MPDENLGDIESDAPGTGARFNAGKPPLHLIPLEIIASWLTLRRLPRAAGTVDLPQALRFLGQFQTCKGEWPDKLTLLHVIDELGADWSACARVFDYGRKKYKEWNWVKGMSWLEVISCASRHILAAARGEELDQESGLSHVGHAMCNLVMLWTYGDVWLEGDDRPERKLFWPEHVARETNPAPVRVPAPGGYESMASLEDFASKYGHRTAAAAPSLGAPYGHERNTA